MKKYLKNFIATVVLVCMIAGVIGCGQGSQNDSLDGKEDQNVQGNIQEGNQENSEIQKNDGEYDIFFDKFKTQYLRIGGGYGSKDCQEVLVFQSREELDHYYETYKEAYHLEPYNPEEEGYRFLDAIERYDEAFFQENDLFLILVEQSSGTPKKDIVDIQRNENGVWNIYVLDINDDVGTADMAYRHLFAEVPGKIYQKDDSFKVNVEKISFEEYYGQRVPKYQLNHIVTTDDCSGMQFPQMVNISTIEDLKCYMEENSNWKGISTLEEACNTFGYNEDYFKEKDLILLVVETERKTSNMEITSIYQNENNNWILRGKCETPWDRLAGMEYQFIFVEIKGNILGEGVVDFVYSTGSKIEAKLLRHQDDDTLFEVRENENGFPYKYVIVANSDAYEYMPGDIVEFPYYDFVHMEDGIMKSYNAGPFNKIGEDKINRDSYKFNTEYTLVGKNYGNDDYTDILVFQSKDELMEYYYTYKDMYMLETVSDGEIISGVWNIIEKYDDEFFEEHDVVLLLLHQWSNRQRKEVKSVMRDENGIWTIYIKDIWKDVTRTDWDGHSHLFIEVKGKHYEEGDLFEVYVERVE